MANTSNGLNGKSVNAIKDSFSLLKRDAYVNNQVETSKLLHNSLQHLEHHQEGGDKLKSFVFGGLDGVLTCFSVIAGASGGRLSPRTILILGLSTIVADAIAMGVGEFLSSKAHRDFVNSELSREQWEFKNYKQGEIDEVRLFA